MEKTTVRFLESLEAIRADRRRRLPLPFVMDRICAVIGELKARRDERTTATNTRRRRSRPADIRVDVDTAVVDAARPGDRRRRADEAKPVDTEDVGSSSASSVGRANRFKDTLDRILRSDGPITMDVQLLKSADLGSVLKEIALQRGRHRAWCLVKSPRAKIPLTTENDYLKARHHGIDWNAGDITVEELSECTAPLFESPAPIYVKGREKVAALGDLLGVSTWNVVGILTGLPSWREMRDDNSAPACPFHAHRSPGLACASKHADVIARHLPTTNSTQAPPPTIPV